MKSSIRHHQHVIFANINLTTSNTTRRHARHATTVSPDPKYPPPPIPSLPEQPNINIPEYQIRSQAVQHQTVTTQPAPTIQLSNEQRTLVDIMHQGKNVYFTGRAGTGKSHVLKAFIQEARDRNRKVAVTAPSGIAAVHIGGQTLHSYFSLWPNWIREPEKLRLFIQQSNWRMAKYDSDVIILDEASMICPHVFNALHYLMLHLRSPSKRDPSRPFAGAQIILCGDFYQLPPIDNTVRGGVWVSAIERMMRLANEDTPYLFDSNAWQHLMLNQMHVSELNEVYRQTDPYFVSLLDEMRVGSLSQKSWDLLDACRKALPNDGVLPTRLFAFRKPALKENFRNLSALPGPEICFDCIDHLPIRREAAPLPIDTAKSLSSSRHWENFQADRILPLRKGAQVILLKNMSVADGLVNGARGVITDFQKHLDPKYHPTNPIHIPVVRFTNGKTFAVPYDDFEMEIDDGVVLTRTQIPLKLGWALTIHKSQGMTLDRAELSMPVAFACGQAYVALSRVKSLNGLFLREFSQRAVVASVKVKRFYEGLRILQ
ncbi:hypothetical protein SmJEL517_g03002 [Synchytrium microbalum]|uniref:ATP-dependent DNA helicase n=1 Tax=Synchytrium microbalum TaxID=1806994 RepID=A0A507C4P8_9FUNG|nr:uncharacterized protein SmJEL517_g03002 [Synchytrium microbalum]TPX34368.1 hypothetical protein SmJEL517_g03002 [Synchytrium microbalum]